MRTGSSTVPRWGAWTARLALALGAAMGMAVSAGSAQAATPITHVVIINQENHSFDNVLGDLCARVALGTFVRDGLNQACDGVPPPARSTPVPRSTCLPPTTSSPRSRTRLGCRAHDTSIDNGADGRVRPAQATVALRTNYACCPPSPPGQIAEPDHLRQGVRGGRPVLRVPAVLVLLMGDESHHHGVPRHGRVPRQHPEDHPVAVTRPVEAGVATRSSTRSGRATGKAPWSQQLS